MKKRHSQNLACAFSSYQYSLQMVHFVLHDFCRKTGEPFFLLMEIFIFIADCDIVIAPAEAAAKEAEASFLCFVTGKGVQDDFRIIHEKEMVFFPHCNDGLRAADHVGRHAYAGITVGGQGVQKVPAVRSIFPAGLLRFPLEEEDIFDNRTNHENAPFVLSDT